MYLYQILYDIVFAQNGNRRINCISLFFLPGCGGYFTSPTGTFTSPNYPNPYPHRRVCEWKITVATGSAVKLTVSNFDVEAHTNCRFDSLVVCKILKVKEKAIKSV